MASYYAEIRMGVPYTGVSEKEKRVTLTPVGARTCFTTFSHSSETTQAITTASTLSALMTSGASLIVQ